MGSLPHSENLFSVLRDKTERPEGINTVTLAFFGTGENDINFLKTS